jgi:hypothetical protein
MKDDNLQGGAIGLSRWTEVFGVACVLLLAVLPAHLQSLTMDEPYHILAGYDSLRYGRNTVDFAHPPLVKAVAALPLLVLDSDLFPASTPEGALADSLRIFEDRSRLQAATQLCRGMALVAFGLPFLALSCALGGQVAGRSAGVMLSVMLGTSFSVFPYLGIVQTDVGAGVGFLVALVGAIRFQRTADIKSLALMGLGLGLALATKYSGVLLAPALAVAVWLGDGPPRNVSRPAVAELPPGQPFLRQRNRPGCHSCGLPESFDQGRGRQHARLGAGAPQAGGGVTRCSPVVDRLHRVDHRQPDRRVPVVPVGRGQLSGMVVLLPAGFPDSRAVGGSGGVRRRRGGGCEALAKRAAVPA